MAEEIEVDEFGIPIKRQATVEVDEFGIPLKKKEPTPASPAQPTKDSATVSGQQSGSGGEVSLPKITLGEESLRGGVAKSDVIEKPKMEDAMLLEQQQRGQFKIDESARIKKDITKKIDAANKSAKEQSLKASIVNYLQKLTDHFGGTVAQEGEPTGEPADIDVDIYEPIRLQTETLQPDMVSENVDPQLRERVVMKNSKLAKSATEEFNVAKPYIEGVTKLSQVKQKLGEAQAEYDAATNVVKEQRAAIDADLKRARMLNPEKMVELGFTEGFEKSLEQTTIANSIADMYMKGDDDKVKNSLESLYADSVLFPQEETTGGMIGGMIGGQVKPLAVGFGLGALNPALGVVGGSAYYGRMNMGSSMIEAYATARAQGMDADDAYEVATKQAKVGFATGAAEGLVGMVTMGGKPVQSAVTETFKRAVKSTLKEAGVDGAVAGGLKAVENVSMQKLGLDVETDSGVMQEMAAEALFGTAMHMAMFGGKKVLGANYGTIINGIAKMPFNEIQAKVNEAVKAGVLDAAKGEQFLTEVRVSSEAQERLKGVDIPEKKQDTVIELQKQINQTEKDMENASPAVVPALEKKIEDLSAEMQVEAAIPLTAKEKTELNKLQTARDENKAYDKDRLKVLEKRQKAAEKVAEEKLQAEEKAKEEAIKRQQEEKAAEEQDNDIEAKKADIEIGKVGNTEYEVKSDGVYFQGKKLDNPENKTHRQLIEADIKRRRQEELKRPYDNKNKELADANEIASYGETYSDALDNLIKKQQELNDTLNKKQKEETKDRGVHQYTKEELEAQPEYKEIKRLDRLINQINSVYGEAYGFDAKTSEGIKDIKQEIVELPQKRKTADAKINAKYDAELEALSKPNTNETTPTKEVSNEGNSALRAIESTAKALEDSDFKTNTPIKGLSVRMSDLRIAEDNLSKGKKSITPNEPIDVTINLTTGNRELSDGYHRYLDARGGTIEKAKTRNLEGSLPAKIKFEINEKGSGFVKTREATNKEISEAYHKAKADGSNPELVKAVEELLGAKESQATPLQSEAESKAITEQIETFGVGKEQVKPVQTLIEKTFEGLRKAGLTTAKTVSDWVGIGKGQEKPYSLKINGKETQVKNVQPEVVNGFYSPLEKVIAETKFDKLPAKQWVEKFAKGEEAKWTGLTDWLNQQQGSVSKADIQQYLKDNRIQVVEVVKTQKDYRDDWDKENDNPKDLTKFSQYQLEGEKENYKEVLVTMPSRVRFADKWAFYKSKGYSKEAFDVLDDAKKQDLFIEFKAEDKRQRESSVADFKSSHFDEPNILVHLRMNTRVDAEGKKVLFLEEIQSDWGQKGKKEGFGGDMGKLRAVESRGSDGTRWNVFDGGRLIRPNVFANSEADAVATVNRIETERAVPQAPFVTETTSWTKLGLKVALKEAVKQGADKIAWTTGEQQNERYDLSKQVDDIYLSDWSDRWEEGNKWRKVRDVEITVKGGDVEKLIIDEKGQIIGGEYDNKNLSDVIGKDITEKILNEKEGTNLQGEGLKVGGKGMKGFYGSPTEGSLGIVGNVAKKLFGQEPKTIDVFQSDKLASGWSVTTKDINGNVQTNMFDSKSKGLAWLSKQEELEVLSEDAEGKNYTTQHSITITPEMRAEVEGKGQPLFKEAQAQYRIESGKNIIEAIKNFDGSQEATVALTHEIMHPTVVSIIDGAKEGNEVGARHTKTIIDEYNKANPKNKITEEQLIADNDAFKNGNTTKQYRAVQEFIAEAWERYHLEGGKGFSAEFQKVLQQITEAFKAVYSSLTGKELTPELRKMFDEILGKEFTGQVENFEAALNERTDKKRDKALKNFGDKEADARGLIEDYDTNIEKLKAQGIEPTGTKAEVLADMLSGKYDEQLEAGSGGVGGDKTFTTHKGEVVTGKKLTDAINKVADDMVKGANKKRQEYYASHITEKQKDEFLAKDLKYAEEVRQGEHLNNLTIAQRINYELTGESIPILPKEQSPKATEQVEQAAENETMVGKTVTFEHAGSEKSGVVKSVDAKGNLEVEGIGANKGVKYTVKKADVVSETQEDVAVAKQEAQKENEELGKKINTVIQKAIKKQPTDAKKVIKNMVGFQQIADLPNRLFQNYVANKVRKYEDALAKALQKGSVSQNAAWRNIADFISSYSRGAMDTMEYSEAKRQKLTGGINKAKQDAEDLHGQMWDLIGGDVDSADRVHQVLDPDLRQTGLRYDDLTDAEKDLHDLLKSINEYTHNQNFLLGKISKETYDKYKGKYIGREYDFDKLYDQKIGGKTLREILGIYKQRQEVDAEKTLASIKDPIYLTLRRFMQTGQNMAVNEYAHWLYRNYRQGNSFGNAEMISNTERDGFIKLGQGFGALSDKWVARSIAEDFKGFQFTNDFMQLAYDLTKAYDGLPPRQFMKELLTVFNPQVQIGNITSNAVFSWLGGVDLPTYLSKAKEAYGEIKNRGQVYRDLQNEGLIGVDFVSTDLKPMQPQIGGQPENAFRKVERGVREFYQGVDDAAKIQLYLSLKDMGYSHKEAVQTVFESLQNYQNTGRIWDLASKTPIVGNAFIKFTPEMLRLLKNGMTRRPLHTLALISLLSSMPKVLGKMFGNDDEEIDAAGRQKGIPKIMIPYTDLEIPLSWRLGDKRVNIARYLMPMYMYDVGGESKKATDLVNKFIPYQLKQTEEGGLTPVNVQDPFVAPLWGILTNKDFRDKPIVEETDDATDATIKRLRYGVRGYGGFYANLVDDIFSTSITGEDYYGRRKDALDVALNVLIKIETFDDERLKQGIIMEFDGYERLAQKIYSGYTKKRKKLDSEIKEIQSDENMSKERKQELIAKKKAKLVDVSENVLEDIADIQEQQLKATEYYRNLSRKQPYKDIASEFRNTERAINKIERRIDGKFKD